MWVHNLNPTILKLGFLEVRWYGLVYVLGFFIAVYWLLYLRKKGQLELSKNEIWDFGFYLMLGVLVGSRLFMIFWRPEIYLFKPWNLFKIWEGGMSFHGGFVGIVVMAWYYCKKKNIAFWKMADLLSIPAILVLGLGRIANFINGELIGRKFLGKWCVVFPESDNLCRHPSTLYAAIKRFLVFGWVLILYLKDSFTPGFIFWNMVFFEGLGRIIVDFFRVDPLYFGFTLGQWFSLVMVIVSLWFFYTKYRKDCKKLFRKT